VTEATSHCDRGRGKEQGQGQGRKGRGTRRLPPGHFPCHCRPIKPSPISCQRLSKHSCYRHLHVPTHVRTLLGYRRVARPIVPCPSPHSHLHTCTHSHLHTCHIRAYTACNMGQSFIPLPRAVAAHRDDLTWHVMAPDERSAMPLGNGDTAVSLWTEAATGDVMMSVSPLSCPPTPFLSPPLTTGNRTRTYTVHTCTDTAIPTLSQPRAPSAALRCAGLYLPQQQLRLHTVMHTMCPHAHHGPCWLLNQVPTTLTLTRP